jgi:flagellar biosynthesis protein
VSAPDKVPLAVALTYDAPSAPRVVAVGRGEIGQRIIDTAREHGVPLESNAPLAEALSAIELETEIPVELYQAVAVIIGFIMRAADRAPPIHAGSITPRLGEATHDRRVDTEHGSNADMRPTPVIAGDPAKPGLSQIAPKVSDVAQRGLSR